MKLELTPLMTVTQVAFLLTFTERPPCHLNSTLINARDPAHDNSTFCSLDVSYMTSLYMKRSPTLFCSVMHHRM